MISVNSTSSPEFFLLGFPGLQDFRFGLFAFFLLIHILTLIGNAVIIVLVSSSHHLQSPMYFFLCHLSLSDIIFTIDVIPNMLYIIWEDGGLVTFTACLTQFQFFGGTTSTECLLLTVMSYDRYLAICKPLHYSCIMNLKLQYQMTLFSWLFGHMMTFCITIQMSHLQFCGSKIIDHYFCDFAPILDFACSDVSFLKVQVTMTSIILVPPPFFAIVFTYCYIFLTIHKISSLSGRRKAFYTCSSHLTVVCAYYGSLIAIYLSSSNGHSFKANKLLSLLNTVGTPLFNPIIYSLRNMDIRAALFGLFNTRLYPFPHNLKMNNDACI